ncbi:hypothetical protein L2E82_04750 [Cichorium intybus]|uniref:Uncharacterized protein n=1 Tax=Cichorium intybus TaxID=13427 RepID=A0ACB9H702_CICIN|nr:hypothetical protein L2E82_04750 [Cichorium intybus]
MCSSSGTAYDTDGCNKVSIEGSFLPRFNAASASISNPAAEAKAHRERKKKVLLKLKTKTDADAEPDSMTTSVVAETTDDVEDGLVKEDEEVVEEKPTKKPIVKLGDILGLQAISPYISPSTHLKKPYDSAIRCSFSATSMLLFSSLMLFSGSNL